VWFGFEGIHGGVEPSAQLLGIKALAVTSRRQPPQFDERNVADALEAVLDLN
jgi:hypothetical protein